MVRMPLKQPGFVLFHLVIAAAFVLLGFILFFNFIFKNTALYSTAFMPKEEKLKNKPTIYNIGVNPDKFDPATGKAGDFVFTREKGFDGRLFLEFGYPVKNDRGEKILPSPTYFLPKGTKITAVSPGKVVDVRSQRESNDFELSIQPEDAPGWRISYDHLQNARFKKGDKVNTGDVVGESGDYTMTEISVFIEGTKPEDIENYCLYMLLDDSVKDQYARRILRFVKDWEQFSGNPAMYDEENWVFPGCRYEKINEAQALGQH